LQATQNPWVNVEVVEGARYKVREVMFLGVNAVPSEQVFSLSQIHPEDILDMSKVRETLESSA
jgi:outer membrane protein assembly factor BamA